MVKNEVALYNLVVMYLFRGVNYRAFGARLTKLSGGQKPNVKAITETLTQNGKVVRCLKVWMFFVVKNKCDAHRSAVLAEQWSVVAEELSWFCNASRATLTYLKKLARQFKALTLEKLDAGIVRIVNETESWLGKFVNRKLRFVIQSQGLHRHDIENELLYKGIQGLYVMYPCVQSALHAQNVVKRVIHNQGINMIHHYTTQKIGRLLRDANGAFSARVVALDSLSMRGVAAPDSCSDLSIDINRKMSNLLPKQQSLLSLLCGAYSTEFTDWLVSVGGYKIETNEELLDRLQPARYIELALRWLNVKPATGRRFMESLRDTFMHYRIQT